TWAGSGSFSTGALLVALEGAAPRCKSTFTALLAGRRLRCVSPAITSTSSGGRTVLTVVTAGSGSCAICGSVAARGCALFLGAAGACFDGAVLVEGAGAGDAGSGCS